MEDNTAATSSPSTPLPIEETPPLADISQSAAVSADVSSPIPDSTVNPEPTNPEPVSPPRRFFPFRELMINIILFAILFIAGIGVSMLLKQLFTPRENSGITSELSTPTPPPLLPESEQKTANWETYQITSGVTKAPLPGISFRLPSEVLRPICDTSGCASQGSYLLGGSRFTVAARGEGQLLSDYRLGTLSDLSGRAFTVSDATVAGKLARDFRGDFTGTTNGGYSFNRLHGVMLPLTDTTSIEFNHFAPSGLAVDFTADEALFADILSTIKIEVPVASSSPTPLPSSVATPSAASTPTNN